MKKIDSTVLQSETWIIEDDLHFSKQLFELINFSQRFSCSKVFSSCEPAIEILKAKDPPDIILMDLGLPGISGINCIQKIKQIVPEVTIIVLTVFEDTDSILQSISNGASGYLLKGSSFDELINSLELILSGGAPINPQIAKKILELFTETQPHSNYGLTPREKEVLIHLVDGLLKKQIADKMSITFHTVDKHLRSIYTKLQVPSRSQAVSKAIKEKLI
ncbi:MAG TPA: response regulator transcription factor [Ignavibacteriaceae bacterium]|nr:response regulator transcription factor [Ignavibacteriaceae bacterium]